MLYIFSTWTKIVSPALFLSTDAFRGLHNLSAFISPYPLHPLRSHQLTSCPLSASINLLFGLCEASCLTVPASASILPLITAVPPLKPSQSALSGPVHSGHFQRQSHHWSICYLQICLLAQSAQSSTFPIAVWHCWSAQGVCDFFSSNVQVEAGCSIPLWHPGNSAQTWQEQCVSVSQLPVTDVDLKANASVCHNVSSHGIVHAL